MRLARQFSSASFSESLPFNPELKAQTTTTGPNRLVSELRNETPESQLEKSLDLTKYVPHGANVPHNQVCIRAVYTKLSAAQYDPCARIVELTIAFESVAYPDVR